MTSERPGNAPDIALERQRIEMHEGFITRIAPDDDTPLLDGDLDAVGCAVIPGLIDAHTHVAFAGDRIAEFAERSRGATYEDIARSGGGIWKTVLATRAIASDELQVLVEARIQKMIKRGVTTIEGKTGYGLDEETERKLMTCYDTARSRTGMHIVRTFLGAHTKPRDYTGGDYVGDTLTWLDRLHAQKLVDAVDVFVEKTAFTADDARRVAAHAKKLGLGVHLHVDQLSAGGGGALAAEVGALSADHLEHATEADAAALGRASVVATLLPWATLLVSRGAKPPIAAFRTHGVRMAIATDYNPGSAPVIDLRSAAMLAIGLFGLTVDEALAGVTVNAAAALGLPRAGVLCEGSQADMLILSHRDPAALFYDTGSEIVQRVLIGGVIH